MELNQMLCHYDQTSIGGLLRVVLFALLDLSCDQPLGAPRLGILTIDGISGINYSATPNTLIQGVKDFLFVIVVGFTVAMFAIPVMAHSYKTSVWCPYENGDCTDYYNVPVENILAPELDLIKFNEKLNMSYKKYSHPNAENIGEDFPHRTIPKPDTPTMSRRMGFRPFKSKSKNRVKAEMLERRIKKAKLAAAEAEIRRRRAAKNKT